MQGIYSALSIHYNEYYRKMLCKYEYNVLPKEINLSGVKTIYKSLSMFW
jgi:hypothetical protein